MLILWHCHDGANWACHEIQKKVCDVGQYFWFWCILVTWHRCVVHIWHMTAQLDFKFFWNSFVLAFSNDENSYHITSLHSQSCDDVTQKTATSAAMAMGSAIHDCNTSYLISHSIGLHCWKLLTPSNNSCYFVVVAGGGCCSLASIACCLPQCSIDHV